MRYLSSFNRRLRHLRDVQSLSENDVAHMCQVDENLIRCWETTDAAQRCYPTIDQLLTLCFRTRTPLERLLDGDALAAEGQLELPGLCEDTGDLTSSVDELQREVTARMPSSEEMLLLKRFRATDPENRRLIIELLA
ncbi:helix-turn-helix transcriptional regulator [Hydrocarboniclastica marina]|uniref:XRE family transcriptional regulator n=1 Tax=Hydrocarboniclastica marina TaxID=2259620 RepID=A0A4P7XGR9_9ALTE|nr:helix-turn-helix transcriptional regulator [Hydrocarboniclastica marina]QCF25833.1 XRE family transcriptional regulator [Hydrocarboniclastica marina]